MWVKICGITRLEDAVAATSAGVDALGLNFYRVSKRFIEPDAAKELVRDLSIEQGFQRPDLVGVFVNSSADEIERIVRTVGLNAVQFHGEESNELIRDVHRRLPGISLIRAMRVSPERVDACMTELAQLADEVPLAACLLDAYVPGEYGGTGHQLGGSVASKICGRLITRVILAGGLKAENVAAAIQLFRPWGVDTASGVEDLPGRKNLHQIGAFIAQAHGSNHRHVVRLDAEKS